VLLTSISAVTGETKPAIFSAKNMVCSNAADSLPWNLNRIFSVRSFFCCCRSCGSSNITPALSAGASNTSFTTPTSSDFVYGELDGLLLDYSFPSCPLIVVGYVDSGGANAPGDGVSDRLTVRGLSSVADAIARVLMPLLRSDCTTSSRFSRGGRNGWLPNSRCMYSSHVP